MIKIYRMEGRRKYRRLGVIVFITIVLLLLTSTMIHGVMVRAENKRYTPPGQMIEIDGHKMHIYGAGQGSPTVIMTSGSGTPCAYTDFSILAPAVSKVTRVCIYERPGYGWSEHASTPRSTEQIVTELKELLEKAGEKPPYLFVAHSMGAMETLLYAQRFPDEVDGIVLIDGTSPYKHINYPQASIPDVAVVVIRALNHTGILRWVMSTNLIPMLNERLDLLTEENKNIEKAMIFKNLLNPMVTEEGHSLETTARIMEKELDLGEIPLLIFSAEDSLKNLPGWKESQKSLRKFSKNSKQVIVKGADHVSIHHKHAEEISVAIKALIEKVQQDQ